MEAWLTTGLNSTHATLLDCRHGGKLDFKSPFYSGPREAKGYPCGEGIFLSVRGAILP